VSAAEITELAQDKLGYRNLRPGQLETIRLILAGHDTLSVMPTGSGKSAIYQIAALFIQGSTVIVSPLIALQKDQLESIRASGLAGAAIVNSNVRAADKREAFQKFESGDLEFLFLAPEQLANEQTMAKLLANPPSLFVVDEAHCMSEWGHDFRPEYGRLGKFIEQLGSPRILALTATAAPQVREEIVMRLGMKDPRTVVWGFDRPNIALGVETCPDEPTKRRLVVERVKDHVRGGQKPGIVYTATRQHAEDVAKWLSEEANIKAEAYHAGMKKEERERVQDMFMGDVVDVIVATNAFGWASTSPTFGSSSTTTCPRRWMRTTRRSAGPAGTASPPARCCFTARRTPACARRWRRAASWPRTRSRRCWKPSATRGAAST